ncbi:hypothetical protein Scep_007997 [Stephania cephalantha]|uniref:Uncharacterized protein n=1 Tax=Stephania cephalantha TaxID=152367 RepID=A0AAP0KC53_9MAGN
MSGKYDMQLTVGDVSLVWLRSSTSSGQQRNDHLRSSLLLSWVSLSCHSLLS